jgi:RHS repeat-associated protein
MDTDRDRICRIAYGADSDTACNVVYDLVGNIIQQPTPNGTRQLTFFANGNVRSVTDDQTVAQFRYDAFGEVQELDLTGGTASDTRHDRRYGGLIERRDERTGASVTPVLSRKIPGPDGFVATRRGADGPWVFAFGEARGGRFFTDDTGAFVQDVEYSPYGEARSTGAQPGSKLYSREQWNGGDALAALGLSHLGARLYDPTVGRFLSRDPLLIPRTAATTNPYAFAMNDPVNGSDPSGMDCIGVECSGGPGGPCVFCDVYVDADGRGHQLGHGFGTLARAVWGFFFGDGSSSPKPIDGTPARDLTRNSTDLINEVQADLHEMEINKWETAVETERISHLNDAVVRMGLGPLRLVPGPIGRAARDADLIYDCYSYGHCPGPEDLGPLGVSTPKVPGSRPSIPSGLGSKPPAAGRGAKPSSTERGTLSPALNDSPYHPDSVGARVKPEYRANPAHDSRSPLLNPKKTPEPADARAVYGGAARADMGTWYGRGEGGWYRYFSDNAGGAHFSGIVPEAQVPAAILRGP